MKKYIFIPFLVFSFIFNPSTLVRAADSELVVLDSRPSKSLPMPKADEVKSDLKSLDDAFAYMEVTTPYETQFPQKVKTGVNTNDAEVERLTQLLKKKIFKKVPLKNIAIHAQNYGVADARLAKLYIQAMKSVREIHLIVDLNRCVTEEAKNSGKKTWELTEKDFSPENPMSAFILALLKGGMKHASPNSKSKFTLYSIPLEPKVNEKGQSVITDIMHLKDVQYVAYSGDKVVDIYSSHRTYNLTEPNRENRGWIDADPIASQYRFQKALDMQEVFKQGKEIWEIPSRPPLRIIYADGSFQEIAYTDGKFNPNDRWVDIGNKIAQGELKMTKFSGSHFAPTDKDMVEIFSGVYGTDENGVWKKLKPGILDVDPTPNVLLITENKFSGTHGWGIPAYFSGYDVKRPRQPVIWGMPFKSRANVRHYIFQGPNDSGQKEHGDDGAPVGHILHDKLTKIDTPKATYLWNDSLNASNHFANQEVQVMMQMSPKSWISQAVDESLEQMVKVFSSAKYQWIVPGYVGIFRDTVAKFIKHAAREIPLTKMSELMDLLKEAKYEEAAKAVLALAELPTEYDDKVDLKILQARLDRLVKFGKWNMESGTGKALSIQAIQSISMALTFEGNDLAWNLKAALGRILWLDKEGHKVKDLDKVLREAWKVLDVGVEFPTAPAKKKTDSLIESRDGVKMEALPEEHPNAELDRVSKMLGPSRDRSVSFKNCVEGLQEIKLAN